MNQEKDRQDQSFCGSCITNDTDLIEENYNVDHIINSILGKNDKFSENCAEHFRHLVKNLDSFHNDEFANCTCQSDDVICKNCSRIDQRIVNQELMKLNVKLQTFPKLSQINKAAFASKTTRKVMSGRNEIRKLRLQFDKSLKVFFVSLKMDGANSGTVSHIRAVFATPRTQYGKTAGGGKSVQFSGLQSQFASFRTWLKAEMDSNKETLGMYEEIFEVASSWNKDSVGKLILPDFLTRHESIIIDTDPNVDLADLKKEQLRAKVIDDKNTKRSGILAVINRIFLNGISDDYLNRIRDTKHHGCIITGWVKVFVADEKNVNSQMHDLVNEKLDFYNFAMKNSDVFSVFYEALKLQAVKAEIPTADPEVFHRFMMSKLLQPNTLPKRLDDAIKNQKLNCRTIKFFVKMLVNQDDLAHKEDSTLKNKNDKSIVETKDKSVKEVKSKDKRRESEKSSDKKQASSDSKIICNNCKKVGHKCRDCKSTYCYTCKTDKPDHNVWECPEFKSRSEDSTEKSESKHKSKKGKSSNREKRLNKVKAKAKTVKAKAKLQRLRKKAVKEDSSSSSDNSSSESDEEDVEDKHREKKARQVPAEKVSKKASVKTIREFVANKSIDSYVNNLFGQNSEYSMAKMLRYPESKNNTPTKCRFRQIVPDIRRPTIDELRRIAKASNGKKRSRSVSQIKSVLNIPIPSTFETLSMSAFDVTNETPSNGASDEIFETSIKDAVDAFDETPLEGAMICSTTDSIEENSSTEKSYDAPTVDHIILVSQMDTNDDGTDRSKAGCHF